jgi:hypothetical protein
LTVGVDNTGHDVKFFGATASAYMLWDESTDDLILGGVSRLGIGTTAPAVALEVTDTGNQEFVAGFGADDDGTAFISVRTAETQNNLAGLSFSVGAATPAGSASATAIGHVLGKVMNSGGALQGELQFHTNDGDSITQKMVITEAGNVGIGTSAPAKLLEVSAAIPAFRLNSTEGNVGNTDILGEISWKSADAGRSGDPIAYIRAVSSIADGSHTDMIFGTGEDGSAASERFRIRSDGYLTVGHASAYLYYVASYNSNQHYVYAQAIEGKDLRTPATDDFARNGMNVAFTSYDFNGGTTYADGINFSTYGDSSGGQPNFLAINKSSNGIKVGRTTHGNGTTDAYYKNGSIYTCDVTAASDERVKENVITIDSALSKINQLRPVTYNWTDEYIEAGASKNASENIHDENAERVPPETKIENVGLIAQEVLKIIPTVVHKENISMPGTEEYLYNITYSKLVPHMIKAIQELSAKVTSLENA